MKVLWCSFLWKSSAFNLNESFFTFLIFHWGKDKKKKSQIHYQNTEMYRAVILLELWMARLKNITQRAHNTRQTNNKREGVRADNSGDSLWSAAQWSMPAWRRQSWRFMTEETTAKSMKIKSISQLQSRERNEGSSQEKEKERFRKREAERGLYGIKQKRQRLE